MSNVDVQSFESLLLFHFVQDDQTKLYTEQLAKCKLSSTLTIAIVKGEYLFARNVQYHLV